MYEADGSVGAAKGAGIGVKFYASAEDACKMHQNIGVIEPTIVSLYQELYQQWLQTLLSHNIPDIDNAFFFIMINLLYESIIY